MQAGVPRRGERPGDMRVRRARRRTSAVEVRAVRPPRRLRASPLYLVAGFLALIAVGTVLLSLPPATERGDGASFTTALFTATSAVCVTGLVVVDTADFWSPFGEAVILALIQVGGLGFMTSSTLLLVLLGRRISLRQRVAAAEALGRLGAENLPDLIRRIVLATLAIEAVGAVLLVLIFVVGDGNASTRDVWRGVFTAISAFNNAGFDVEGGFQSLVQHRGNVMLIAITAALVVLGGTGYAIWVDVTSRRKWARFALDTKIVLAVSVLLWTLGGAVILAIESRPNGVFEGVSPLTRVIDALGLSVYARTAGFTVLNTGDLADPALFFLSGLMFIGGAAASTAGGIKITTFSVLGFAILASIRGDEHATAFEREIPWRDINRALAIALLSVAIVFALAFGVSATLRADFVDLLFEAVSAFGTVGLSTGVTTELSPVGRIIITIGMFVGRLGPLTIALALAGRMRAIRYRYPEEEVTIG